MTSRNLMRETSLTTFKPIDEEELLSTEDPRSHSLTTTSSQRALTQIRTTGLFGRKSSSNSNFRNIKTNDDNIANKDVNLNIEQPRREVITILQPNPNRKPNMYESSSDQQQSDAEQQSAKSPPGATSSTSGDGNRYNISNLLKHIYSLKYSQKPATPTASASSTSVLTATSTSTATLAATASNSDQAVAAKTQGESTHQHKQFWMPDDQVKECYECNEKFTTFRRRHHCRVCGQIFCGRCSDHEIPSHLIWPNTTGNIRACTFCHSFVGEMETGDIKNNSKSIRELMKRLSLPTTSFSSSSTISDDSSSLTDSVQMQSSPPSSSSQLQQVNQQQQQQQQSAQSLVSRSSSSNSLNSLSGNASSSVATIVGQSGSSAASSASLAAAVASQQGLSNPAVAANTPAGLLLILNQQQQAAANLAGATAAASDDNNPFDVAENRDYFKANQHIDEIKQLIINNSSELRNLWVQVYHTSDGIQFTSKSINKFKRLNNCITGRELVEWLMRKKSVSKDQAIVIGQALIDGKWLELAHQATIQSSSSINSLTSYYQSSSASKLDQIFYDDNSLYRPGKAATSCNRTDSLFEKTKAIQDNDEGPEWIKELNQLVTTGTDGDETLSVGATNQSLASLEIIESQLGDSESTKSPVVIVNHHQRNASLGSYSVKSQQSVTEVSLSSQAKTETKSLFGDDSSSIKSTSQEEPKTPTTKEATQIVTPPKAPESLKPETSSIQSEATKQAQEQPESVNKQQKSSSLSPKSKSPTPSTSSSITATTDNKRRTPTPTTIQQRHTTVNEVTESLSHAHKQLHIELLKQLLKLKNLSFDWFDVIASLTSQCVHLVRPDVKHDNDCMDIRAYIKIKKLPGYASGAKSDSRIINGLVFSKNVAHKGMRADIKQPRVLLLRSSIEYQRTEEKMCSLEPILTAESQYLKNYCSKLVLRHNPDVLIVEKSVARIAQEYFLNAGVSLVLNIKPSIMDKLCRFLQADPMYSIDDPIRKPKLGFCSKFHVEYLKISETRAKSLMFFEGTPTNLGCTILLSGGSFNELATVKSIIRFMIYVAYNSKLEHSFILDKYADFTLKNTMFEIKYDDHYFLPKTSAKVEKQEVTEKPVVAENKKNPKDESEDSVAVVKIEKVKNSSLSSKREISIDQSPLEEVKFGLEDEQEEKDSMQGESEEEKTTTTAKTESSKSSAEESSSDQQKEVTITVNGESLASNKLKLTICEQHKEKLNIGRIFKLLKDDLILSCSPFITFQMPFLLLDCSNSTDDQLRKYLPAFYMNYLKSEILLRETQGGLSPSQAILSTSSCPVIGPVPDENNKLKQSQQQNLHEFLLIHLTKSFDDQEIKRLYADFKSRGGISTANSNGVVPSSNSTTRRLILKETSFGGSNASSSSFADISPEKYSSSRLKAQFDCLDIYSRQQIAVLFYSQCESSPVYPNICIRPRIINMKFYGENDMTLGAFLAKNCFRNGYKCNNELCETLIVYHTRTFVHADSKITIRMSIVPTSQAQQQQQQQLQQQSQQSTANLSSTSSVQKPDQSSLNLNVSALAANSASSSMSSSFASSKPVLTSTTAANNRSNSQILSIASMLPSASSSKPPAVAPSTTSVSETQSVTKTTNQTPTQAVQNTQTQPQPQPVAIQQQQQQPIYDDINIFMWSVCKICNRSTKKMAMSPDTWSFSLAKFLELTFHARNYHQFCGGSDENSDCECKHSLFQDNYQYFRFKNVVVVFSTSKIVIKSLHIPEVLLKPSGQCRSREEYIDDIKELYEKGLSIFQTLAERLIGLKNQTALTLNEKQLQKLDQFIAHVTSDMTLRHKIEKINLLLTNQKSTKGYLNNEYFSTSGGLISESTINSQLSASPNNTLGEATTVAASSVSSASSSVNERQQIDDLVDEHQTITSPTIGNVNYELIDMLLIDLKKFIANNVSVWNTRMSEFFKKPKDDSESSTSGSTPIEIPKSKQSIVQKDDECTLGKQVSVEGQSNNESSASLLLSNQTSTANLRSASSSNPISGELDSSGVISTPTTVAAVSTPDHSKHIPTALQLGKRLIANLMPSSAFQPIKMPFPDDEHYLTQGAESIYYINERSLTSIIAYSLGSKEYKEFQSFSSKLDMIKLQQQASIGLNPNLAIAGGAIGGGSSSSAQFDQDDFDMGSASGTNKGTHFELQFHDSTTKFYCRAYYAELFARLRKVLMPNEEDKYIHSLFHCVNWEAKGGKSNSQFRKTLDQRFVIKEMSKQEYQSFLDFAPHYIQYAIDCVQSKRATAFTKIVGAYRICLMKSTTIGSAKAVKIDVIVMENLFYGKRCQQIFDLKGSERNRLINVQAGSGTSSSGAGIASSSTNAASSAKLAANVNSSAAGANSANGANSDKELVLLDENFLRWTFDNPIYIKPHSKYVLMRAIENDSQFLSSKFIMDYSLLCGFDQISNDIVVGIIDYLRVFTWDKKVETYIKTIGGQGKMPTIVSPEIYRTRFISAIDRYFLEVPDQWYTHDLPKNDAK